MASITIWALESEYDARTVKHLADKLIAHLELPQTFIRVVSKVPKKDKRAKGKRSNTLKKAVRRYLQQDDYVIFVIDTDGPISSDRRRKEPNSLINQVERVLADREFAQKVYLAQAIQEVEAWLLTDCAGIFYFYASQRSIYKKKSRAEIIGDKKFTRLIKKYQKGDTQLIVESELGGKGAKEHLVKFSEEILQTLNPKMRSKNIKAQSYKERLSPTIAEYIEITDKTLRRNASLPRFGQLLDQCCA